MSTWYDYDANVTSHGTNLGSENLDTWIYSGRAQSLSGAAKDFSLTTNSNVKFTASCYSYAGGPINFGLYIVKNREIIKSQLFQFDSNGSRQECTIESDLEAGDYTIVVGATAEYEFGATSDSLEITENQKIEYDEPTHKKSMWCWRETVLDDTARLVEVCEKLKVDAVYQEVTTTSLYTSDKLKNHINTLKNNNIQFYFIFGDAVWYNNLDLLKTRIDIVKNYNDSVSEQYKSQGVVFDVEPHTIHNDGLDTNTRVDVWTETAKQLYLYANNLKVRVIYCNPVWYNAEVRTSFTTYSDGLTYMNYAKTNMITNISEEMQIAEQKNKWIENITEFQSTQYVDEDDSCYDLGIAGVHEIWNTIKSTYPNNNISFSYHYYLPILDLIDDYKTAINKIIYFGETLLDLTEDTITSEKLLKGTTAHDKSGSKITGNLNVQKYYTGSTAPSSSLGNDGDIYLQG